MIMNWTVSEIDLSDAGFWGRPFEERDAAFGVLRRKRPVPFFPEPALPLFQAVLTRMPGLEVTGDPHWLRSSAINGIKHLPVGFTPFRRGG